MHRNGSRVPTKKRKGKKTVKCITPGKKSKPNENASANPSQLPVKLDRLAEEISSDSDSGVSEDVNEDDLSSVEEDITEQEKRVKLAKKYLSQIEQDYDDGGVSERLHRDALEKSGQLQKKLAEDCQFEGVSGIKTFRGHRLSVTCLALSSDDKYVFSGSKGGSIMKCCLATMKKLKFLPGGPKSDPNRKGHSSCVTAITLSSDFKFLASGDSEKIIHIWNPTELNIIKTFTGHRDGITGLIFRLSSHQLFSSSVDRSVKIWNLDEMGYVETLFGHQDAITSIDSLLRDRALTSGGRDNTIRLWKVPEESQLVFQGSGGSTDCVHFINEQHFISGSDNGSISIWGLQKKKPLYTVSNAHEQQPNKESNWITAVTALPNSDLVASGSQDGYIRVWKCNDDFRGLQMKSKIPVLGFVNALQFSKSGSFLLAGIGQEHSRGRWWRIKEAKNAVLVIPLKIQLVHQINHLK